MNPKYHKLFTPIKLPNGVEIRNRIVMAPMTTYSANPDGSLSNQEIAYYEKRAANLGMLITGCIAVSKNGLCFDGQFTAYDDNVLPKLTSLAKAIKVSGTKAILQIQHGGRRVENPAVLPNGKAVSSGNIPSPANPNVTPRELENEEIEQIIKDFGLATKLAIEAGFDGVEIHGAGAYLIQQFFSPHSNMRNDKWGGSIEERMQFPLKIVDEVKHIISSHQATNFIIGYRFSPEEIETPGIRLNDILTLIEHLINKKLDYLHISFLNLWAKSTMSLDITEPITSIISKKISGRVPLISVGGIHTPEEATTALESGASFIALGRELIMDPDWIQKILDDREERIITTIKKNSAQELVIPDKMFERILKVSNWLPFED